MPHRFFNSDEAARYLNLSRRELDRLIKDRDIPFETRGDRTVFCGQDLDGWVSQRILGASVEHLAGYHRQTLDRAQRQAQAELLLAKLVAPGQVEPALKSKTKASVIRDLVVMAAHTGWVYDPVELVATLEAREALGSTALPAGVAFLHPRSQQPYRFETSFLVVGRTVQPIHFGSPDGQPTDLFFLVCCQDDTLHLQTLARLCLVAQKTDLLSQMRAAEDAVVIYQTLLAAEDAVYHSTAASH